MLLGFHVWETEVPAEYEKRNTFSNSSAEGFKHIVKGERGEKKQDSSSENFELGSITKQLSPV